MGVMFREMREVWSAAKLSPEARETVKDIEVLFRQLKSEGKDAANPEECAEVLNLGNDWIEELEAAEVPDNHSLIESIREYMKEFLPVYTEAAAMRAEEKMGLR
jgi:DNA-directed RNA polymerase specialized sigma subunit